VRLVREDPGEEAGPGQALEVQAYDRDASRS
jgi:hypothetical protein